MNAGMKRAAEWIDATFASHGIHLTLGGEPTYVPVHPEGMEWSFSAVGPTKLAYARSMADHLLRGPMSGGAVFFSPGKHYPGEVNPRWALRMLKRRDGRPAFVGASGESPVAPDAVDAFCSDLISRLGVKAKWLKFRESKPRGRDVRALPLDADGGRWISVKWPLRAAECVLTDADGPAGLRLPLYLLPDGTPRRALVVELHDGRLDVFFPPLLQDAFARLLELVGEAFVSAGVTRYELQGYVPQDERREWTVLGLAADPGVLEINLPACMSWRDYDFWITEVTRAAEAVGLRSWKEPASDYVGGTGGGNHLIWGGPSIEENPFFARPAWLASILRYFQKHPSLAYLFTGCYVGASSQAPRPDESAKELFDIEMGYHFLETLGPGDHRGLINETLRHLHTDVTGNAHRSEVSFDKFWNPGWPGGMLGLIEFRAVESLPSAEWMSAVALLWAAIAARCAEVPVQGPLRKFGGDLHDQFFLPAFLQADLHEVLHDLQECGCAIPPAVYDRILDWRFARLLVHGQGASRMIVRRALESWPLLCETPVEGGSTSRFVDTSMHRLEIHATPEFADAFDIYVHGRLLPLRGNVDGNRVAGLRYRRSCLYPCMHPGIPPHLPLEIVITRKGGQDIVKAYEMAFGETGFRPVRRKGTIESAGTCHPIHPRAITVDLRLDG